MININRFLNWNNINKLIWFFGVSTLISGCGLENKDNYADDFYPEGINKIWAHRVNTIEDAERFSDKFYGIEVDLFYIAHLDAFEVRHDKKDSNNLYLDSFLEALSTKPNLHFWFDLKNLNKNQENQISRKMELLFEKYDLFERAFVESPTSRGLIKLQEKNIKTCLWLPGIGDKTEEEIEKQMQNTKENLSKGDFIAISCHYSKVDFFEKYFPDRNFFVWTNGLFTEEDKEIIKKIYKNEKLKIILIDYEDFDFLKD